MAEPETQEAVGSNRIPTGFSGATEGEAVAKLMAYAGVELAEDTRKELEAVTDEAAMKALMDANFGETVNVKPLNAQMIFGTWLMRKIQFQPLILAWWYQNVAAAQDAVRFCQQELRDWPAKSGEKDERDPSRMELFKHYNNAVVGMSVVLEKMQDMAREVGLMKVQKPEKPRNRPPDVFTQTNVLVDARSGTVAVTNEPPST